MKYRVRCFPALVNNLTQITPIAVSLLFIFLLIAAYKKVPMDSGDWQMVFVHASVVP